jgi:hypothetical protein
MMGRDGADTIPAARRARRVCYFTNSVATRLPPFELNAKTNAPLLRPVCQRVRHEMESPLSILQFHGPVGPTRFLPFRHRGTLGRPARHLTQRIAPSEGGAGHQLHLMKDHQRQYRQPE